MPTPDVTGGVRAVMQFVQHGEQRANVLHGIKSTDWSISELTDLANELKSAWDSVWRVTVVDDMVLEAIICTALMGPLSIQFTLGCTSNCAGASTATPAPGNASATLSWRTTGIGRSKRGRTFPAGFQEQNINDDDSIASGFLVSLTAIASALIIAFANVPGAQLGVFSRVLNQIFPVSTVVVENTLDTQRRRLPGRGR